MKYLGNSAFGTSCCVLTISVAPFTIAQAAPMAGLSFAATSVQGLAETSIGDLVPGPAHYRRHHHHHDHCLASFYRCFYGDLPRYYFPSYRYRLDAYTYFYPPFYW